MNDVIFNVLGSFEDWNNDFCLLKYLFFFQTRDKREICKAPLGLQMQSEYNKSIIKVIRYLKKQCPYQKVSCICKI